MRNRARALCFGGFNRRPFGAGRTTENPLRTSTPGRNFGAGNVHQNLTCLLRLHYLKQPLLEEREEPNLVRR